MDEVEDISLSLASASGSRDKQDAIAKSLNKHDVVAKSIVVDESIVEPESEGTDEEVIIKDFTPARVDSYLECNGRF